MISIHYQLSVATVFFKIHIASAEIEGFSVGDVCPGPHRRRHQLQVNSRRLCLPELQRQDLRAGIDVTKLHFGQKLFGEVFILQRTNFRPKTTDLNVTCCVGQ
jgi:hypothetical protein